VNARQLLQDLTARGVVLTAADGRIRYGARAEVFTEADLACLAEHKQTLLAFLTAPCLDCGSALPQGHLYRCQPCMVAAWKENLGTEPPLWEDPMLVGPALQSGAEPA
jgi:hypothetical protein